MSRINVPGDNTRGRVSSISQRHHTSPDSRTRVNGQHGDLRGPESSPTSMSRIGDDGDNTRGQRSSNFTHTRG